MAKTIHIADTIHGSVKLNELEKQVISTQIFNRLHSISQNSTVYLTFPTNRTKRFEHSIGTMSLCGKMFKQSISNADDEALQKFFTAVEEIIDLEIESNLYKYEAKYRSKLGDANLSKYRLNIYKNSVISDEYNDFIPVNVKQEYRNTYVILFQAVRLSALMHDVGHPPFSHITEFALKQIWNKISVIPEESRNTRQKGYLSAMQQYFDTPQDLHEQIGNKITDKVLDSIIDNVTDEDADELLGQQVFKVLVAELTSGILQEKLPILGQIHRIIDGTLDGDRLDYVSRDPINSGLNVGIIEYDRIISGMRLIEREGRFLFLPSSKNIDSLEDFFNRRWKMYKQIIYHHRVIKTDYLLQSCIEDLAMKYLQDESQDEEEIRGNILPYDISGLWKAIAYKPSHRDFFDSLIQWDDGWLMAVLKKHYFNMYLNAHADEKVILCKLEELLANKKNYFSQIKRVEDFAQIDKQVAKIMFPEYNSINKLIEQMRSEPCDEEGNIVVPLDKSLEYIERIGKVLPRYTQDTLDIPRAGFILAKIKSIYTNLFGDPNWMQKTIEESIEELKQDASIDVKDAIGIIKKIKTGLENGLEVYRIRDNEVKIIKLSELSNQSNILLSDVGFMPVFYLYILKGQDCEKIRYKFSEILGKKIIAKIKVRLEELK